MNFDLIFILLSVGLAQAIFLIITVLLLKNKRRASVVAIISIVLCFSFLIVVQILRYLLPEEYIIMIIRYGSAVPLLIGPLHLIYILSLITNESFMQRKLLLIHFAPFVLLTLMLFVPSLDNLYDKSFFAIFKFLHSLAYYIFSLSLLSKHLNQKKFATSKRLLKRLILFQIAIVLIIYLIVALERSFPAWNIETDFISGLILSISFFVFVLVIILYPEAIFPNDKKQYQLSALTEGQKEEISEKIRWALEEDKLYLNPDLTLHLLSNELEINVNYLSQVVNELLGKNFNQLINEYRVGEVKRHILDDKRSLLSVVYSSGFKSKSSFNRIFKELEGLTPSAYKKEVKKKSQIMK